MTLHLLRTWHSKHKNIYKKVNEIVYAALTLAFGFYYPFIILKFASTNKGVIFSNGVDELTLIGNIVIVGGMSIIFLWALSAKIRTIRHPELLRDLYNYTFFCKKLLEQYSNSNQIKRKLTHIIPGAVVSICIMIFYYFFQNLLGPRWINYALFFVVCIGIDFALTFLGEDLIRLFDFSFMPPSAIKLCMSGLTPEELDTFSSTSVMVFAFGPFIFLAFPIFFMVLMITSVADAMASIVGIFASKKKHFFPKTTNKTVEGYIGGYIFSFISIVFGGLFSNYFGLSEWSLQLILTLALIISIWFFLIDLFTSKFKLQDNYLNPFIIGLVMIITLMSMNIPVF